MPAVSHARATSGTTGFPARLHLPDREGFGSGATDKESLETAHRAPAFLLHSLHEPCLQSPYVTPTSPPIDGVPVERIAAGRSSNPMRGGGGQRIHLREGD